jgi:EmrB/QacA subfamily drug resistance transporter
MFMSVMDHTIVNVAIPTLRAAFAVDLQAVQWVVTIYMITQAIVIPIAPYLGAKLGVKRAYVWTLTAFLGGSALCGFAWDLPSLVVFRCIQGIGGGILLPLVHTLLYQTFAPEERGTASSAMGAAMMIAPVFGPVLGGYLVGAFGWPWAFFVNVPLGIVAINIAQRVLLPAAPAPQTRFDHAGFLTATLGIAALLYGVTVVTHVDEALWAGACLLGSAILLGVFVGIELRRLRRGALPLLDLRRFGERTFALSTLAIVLQSLATFGIVFLIPSYLQTVRQVPITQSGAIQGAQALATLLTLPLAGRLSDQLGPRPVALAGLIVLMCATGLLLRIGVDTPIPLLVGILALLGCAGALATQIQVAAMARTAKEAHHDVAHGATLIIMLRATAAPVSVALLSSIVQAQSQRYQDSLARAGLGAVLLQRHSTMLAMRDSFLVSACLAALALLALLVASPRRRGQQARASCLARGETPLEESHT